jgi:hypothetical protein
VELILTTDVGPRVIRYGFVGDKNEFKEFPEMVGKTGGDEWRIYGGHRLWHSPEYKPRCYFPDNFLVKIEKHGSMVRLIQPIETTTGILKEIDIELAAKGTHVKVTHRLKNANLWPIELAPWALSVMAAGGKVVIPLPPRAPSEGNLLPTGMMGIWTYTDMADARWTWGTKYIMLRQDVKATCPQKIGLMNTDGWMAYINAGNMFVNKFEYVQGANYPDFGCSVETYTNSDMLEVETVAPLCKLDPEKTVEHVENWFLFKGVETPMNDTDIDKNVLPKVISAKG